MTVSGEIINVLDALCEKFGIVMDWTSQNVVPQISVILTKIVNYELWTSVAWLLLFTIPLVVCLIDLCQMNKHGYNKALNCTSGNFSVKEVFFIIVCILSVIGIMVIIHQIFDIITCLTFPEKIVFGFIKGLGLVK